MRVAGFLFVFITTSFIFGLISPQAQTDSLSSCPTEIAYGLRTIRTEFDSETRRYLIYVPESLNATEQVPLVLSLHGFTSNSQEQMNFSQWNPIADEYGFIVIYPQGAGFPSRWSTGQQVMQIFQDRDDLGFIKHIVDQVSESYCVDENRIYVNGLSNGGGMTNRLACNMADTFAAVGMVAGAYTTSPEGCHPSRPMPIIAFHGTDDPVVPYHGGQAGGFDLSDVLDWAKEWAERNGCNTEFEQLTTPEDVDYSGIRYGDCDESVEVIFFTIDDGGHTWPGGGPQPEFLIGKLSQDINASETMWAFFSRYALSDEG